MALIEELIKQIPMAEKLLEIKGVGIRTVSGFLAEVGDISRFNNPKELQKLAGLALVENSSGKHKGETTISRRGRKRLRYLLFEVAMSLVAKNKEFGELHHYYTTRKLNPLKKMQSLMAVAAKLLRVFFAMLTKGVDYDPQKMISDIKRPAVYLQAAKTKQITSTDHSADTGSESVINDTKNEPVVVRNDHHRAKTQQRSIADTLAMGRQDEGS